MNFAPTRELHMRARWNWGRRNTNWLHSMIKLNHSLNFNYGNVILNILRNVMMMPHPSFDTVVSSGVFVTTRKIWKISVKLLVYFMLSWLTRTLNPLNYWFRPIFWHHGQISCNWKAWTSLWSDSIFKQLHNLPFGTVGRSQYKFMR